MPSGPKVSAAATAVAGTGTLLSGALPSATARVTPAETATRAGPSSVACTVAAVVAGARSVTGRTTGRGPPTSAEASACCAAGTSRLRPGTGVTATGPDAS